MAAFAIGTGAFPQPVQARQRAKAGDSGTAKQYTSAGHVLSFDVSGYWVSNETDLVHVRFEHGRANDSNWSRLRNPEV